MSLAPTAGKVTGDIIADAGLTQAPRQHHGKAGGVRGPYCPSRAGAGCCLHTRAGMTAAWGTQDRPQLVAVPSRQASRSSRGTNVSPSCWYGSLRFLSPGNSQHYPFISAVNLIN